MLKGKMKTILIILSILSFNLYASEIIPEKVQKRLLGTWKSNKEKSLSYNTKFSKGRTAKQEDFLKNLLGKLIVNYQNNGFCKSILPSYILENEGDPIGREIEYDDGIDPPVVRFLD